MASRRPILSPIARPGRRYVSGIIYLAAVLVVALGFLLVRRLLG
jgi:hypothetical protein